MPPMPRRVVLGSPYNKPSANLAENVKYGFACIKECLVAGEAPVATHILYAEVLSAEKPDDYQTGIRAAHVWIPRAELVVMYIDRGIGPGMEAGLEVAGLVGTPIEYRSLGLRDRLMAAMGSRRLSRAQIAGLNLGLQAQPDLLKPTFKEDVFPQAIDAALRMLMQTLQVTTDGQSYQVTNGKK